MQPGQEKRNQAKFDNEATILVGPSSKPFKASEVAQSPYLTHRPSPPVYSRNLSETQLAQLADRCSTKHLQDEVRKQLHDQRVAMALRRRLLAWTEAQQQFEDILSSPETKRRKTRSVKAKQEDEASIADALLEKMNAEIPRNLQFLNNPDLSAPYYQREGRLEQSCIRRAQPTHMLRSKGARSGDFSTLGQSNIAGLILYISVYARPIRGLWAKERVRILSEKQQATLLREAESASSASEDGESSPSGGNAQDGRRGRGGRGLYGPLILVQKMEIPGQFTLKALRDSFLCRLDDLPQIIHEGEGQSLPRYHNQKRRTESFLDIEDQLYCEGLDDRNSEARSPGDKPMSLINLSKITLESLTLCTGKLYGFVHHGSCEHLWTITSMRAKRQDDGNDFFPLTTFYASAAISHPLARWAQPKNLGTSLPVLEQCDLCKGKAGSLLLLGGSRFRSSGICGLKQDTTRACQTCTAALFAIKTPSFTELVEGTGSYRYPPYEEEIPLTEERMWTIVPILD